MPAARERSLADPLIRRSEIFTGATSPKYTILLLAVLTLAGAWLRLSHLGSKSLWLDEGATVALARASWQHFAWVWWYGEANLQTVYFLLMRGWIHLGQSEAWIRLPPALFGIASVPLIFVVARKFLGDVPALASAALLAFNPTHVSYSQEARSYTLTIFLVLLSAYYFVRAAESDRRKDWAAWTLVSVLAFYSHDFAALVLIAQACSLFFKAKPAPWRPVVICGVVILLAALPSLTYVFRASPENLHFLWMPRPSAKEFWHLAMFFGGGGAKVAVAVILWIAGLLAIWRSRRFSASDEFWRGMLIVLWAVLPPAITALTSLLHPMFLQRYMIFSLPATILLAGLGVSVLGRWHVGLVLVAALCAMSIPTIFRDYSKPFEDWRAASSAILSTASPGDAVVFFPFYTRVVFDYYRDRHSGSAPVHVFAPPYYAGGDDVVTLLKALDSNAHQFPHVWVVVYGPGAQVENFDYGSVAKGKLQAVYGPPAMRKFTGIQVLEFGP